MRGKAQRDVRPEVSQMETFAKFPAPKFWGERPEIICRIYSPMATHQTAKFGAIPPKDPDDISRSAPDFLVTVH